MGGGGANHEQRQSPTPPAAATKTSTAQQLGGSCDSDKGARLHLDELLLIDVVFALLLPRASHVITTILYDILLPRSVVVGVVVAVR